MPRLPVRITKRRDRGYVIACERPDGTVTWQRGVDAAFFPVHDLTHYAVETGRRWTNRRPDDGGRGERGRGAVLQADRVHARSAGRGL